MRRSVALAHVPANTASVEFGAGLILSQLARPDAALALERRAAQHLAAAITRRDFVRLFSIDAFPALHARTQPVYLRSVRRQLRTVYHHLSDRLGTALNQRDSLIPPLRLVTVDGSRDVREFVFMGEAMSRWLIELGLQSTDRVLDLGSGVGRVGIPLAKYLQPPGSYHGVDVVPEQVAWCSQAITRRYPHFTFELLDVYSTRYNPKGKTAAEQARLSIGDGAFDFALAMSLFTHLLSAASRNYLAEARRVLRPSGTFVLSAFLLNDESRAAMAQGLKDSRYQFGVQVFPHEYERGCFISNTQVPEASVAYDEPHFLGFCRAAGLEVERVIYGSWCGRPGATLYQDVLILKAG